jgi:serine protease inhibitor
MTLSAQPAPKPRVFEMIVNRPFFFAIRDDHSNTILFMGCGERPHMGIEREHRGRVLKLRSPEGGTQG